MSDLRKVQPGEPLVIPADTYNTFIDVAQDYQNRQLNRQQHTTLSNSRDGDMILIKNNSGADRARFEVLGINAPLVLPTDNLDQFVNQPALSGVTPTSANHWGRFVILAEPIRNGALGRAWVSGVCPAKVDIVDEEHWHADITSYSCAHLTSDIDGPAQILWKESGTGVKWTIVRLGRRLRTFVFPIMLSQVGGQQGTSTTAASWTYDVFDARSGRKIASNVNPTSEPHRWRRPIGQMSPAYYGYAHYSSHNLLTIGWINEVVVQEPCS